MRRSRGLPTTYLFREAAQQGQPGAKLCKEAELAGVQQERGIQTLN